MLLLADAFPLYALVERHASGRLGAWAHPDRQTDVVSLGVEIRANAREMH
jgi:hypothetical protein